MWVIQKIDVGHSLTSSLLEFTGTGLNLIQIQPAARNAKVYFWNVLETEKMKLNKSKKMKKKKNIWMCLIMYALQLLS